MSKLTLQAAGPDAKRILRDDKIVGMLLRLSNGRWGVFDTDEKRLTAHTFEIPAAAWGKFVELEAKATKEA